MAKEAVAIILVSLLAVGLAHDETCTTLGLLSSSLLVPAMRYTSTTSLAEETMDTIGSTLLKDYVR